MEFNNTIYKMMDNAIIKNVAAKYHVDNIKWMIHTMN